MWSGELSDPNGDFTRQDQDFVAFIKEYADQTPRRHTKASLLQLLKRISRERSASDPKIRRAGHAPEYLSVRSRTLDPVNVDAPCHCPRRVSSRTDCCARTFNGTDAGRYQAYLRSVMRLGEIRAIDFCRPLRFVSGRRFPDHEGRGDIDNFRSMAVVRIKETSRCHLF